MNTDLELNQWQKDWQSESRHVSDLRARVDREMRAIRLYVIGELVVTILFGGGSIAWALVARRVEYVVLAIGIWVLIAAAWTSSYLLRRDAWAPAALGTLAYLDFTILRCRRRREAIYTNALLYLTILGFDLGWLWWVSEQSAAGFLVSPPILPVWLVSVILLVGAIRQLRRLATEERNLRAMRHNLVSDV